MKDWWFLPLQGHILTWDFLATGMKRSTWPKRTRFDWKVLLRRFDQEGGVPFFKMLLDSIPSDLKGPVSTKNTFKTFRPRRHTFFQNVAWKHSKWPKSHSFDWKALLRRFGQGGAWKHCKWPIKSSFYWKHFYKDVSSKGVTTNIWFELTFSVAGQANFT